MERWQSGHWSADMKHLIPTSEISHANGPGRFGGHLYAGRPGGRSTREFNGRLTGMWRGVTVPENGIFGEATYG